MSAAQNTHIANTTRRRNYNSSAISLIEKARDLYNCQPHLDFINQLNQYRISCLSGPNQDWLSLSDYTEIKARYQRRFHHFWSKTEKAFWAYKLGTRRHFFPDEFDYL